jgi:putative glutamine amidotransferase
VTRTAPPLIGLTTYVEPITHHGWAEAAAFTPSSYVGSVIRAGGAPLLLPPGPAGPRRVLGAVAGLVLIGGPDVDPALYGAEPHPSTDRPRPERDAWEAALCRAALEMDLPLLAVCRGTQLLNVALGGTLHQHLEEVVGHTGHRAQPGRMGPVAVTVEPSTQLAAIVGDGEGHGLCHHHQAIDRLGDGLVVTARAADGTVEAVELPGRGFAVGVQWHPEEDTADDRLFAALVERAAKREAADSLPV